jgi:hypothetical protein
VQKGNFLNDFCFFKKETEDLTRATRDAHLWAMAANRKLVGNGISSISSSISTATDTGSSNGQRHFDVGTARGQPSEMEIKKFHFCF